MKRLMIAAACMAAMTSIGHADLLSGEEIKSVIGGKRVYLATGFGIEFPMYYRANGEVTGDGTGTGLGRYFAPKETGDWWVSGNEMCQQFPTWYDGRPLCFQLRQNGDGTLKWYREDGKSGTARVAG